MGSRQAHAAHDMRERGPEGARREVDELAATGSDRALEGHWRCAAAQYRSRCLPRSGEGLCASGVGPRRLGGVHALELGIDIGKHLVCHRTT